MITAIFQAVLSTSVVAFSMFLIASGRPSESAWTILSSIVAYWMPSPTSTLMQKVKDKD